VRINRYLNFEVKGETHSQALQWTHKSHLLARTRRAPNYSAARFLASSKMRSSASCAVDNKHGIVRIACSSFSRTR
jgi:hypothetical protein